MFDNFCTYVIFHRLFVSKFKFWYKIFYLTY